MRKRDKDEDRKEKKKITEKDKAGCRRIGLRRSVSTMHPYQLENWCVQWERKRRGKAVSYEGDGIRTKSARERGRKRGPVPDLPLSRLEPGY